MAKFEGVKIMFKLICEVCKAEPQFKTVEAAFPEEKRKLNVCMDCAYMIEEMEKKEHKTNEYWKEMRHLILSDLKLNK